MALTMAQAPPFFRLKTAILNKKLTAPPHVLTGLLYPPCYDSPVFPAPAAWTNAAIQGTNRNSRITPNPLRSVNREPQAPLNQIFGVLGIKRPVFKRIAMLHNITNQLIRSAWMLVHSYLKYLAHDPPFLPHA